MNEYYNIAFEKSLLSTFLYNPEQFDDYRETLQSIDFYLPSHLNIYEAMMELSDSNKPIDEEFIKQELNKRNLFDEQVMMQLLIANPISNLQEYVNEVKDLSNQRKLLSLSTQLKDNFTVDEKVDFLKNNIDNIENSISITDEINCDDLLKSEFENKVTYDTGIDVVSDLIGGLEKSQLIYITGAEETGKTHISYKIMENLSAGFKVGIISLEFGKRKLKERLEGMIKRGHKLDPSNIKASFESRSINKVEKIIKKWVSEGVGFIVIDSFNLIENMKNKDNNVNVIDTGRRLFKLTQQLDVLLLVISTSTKADHKEGNPSIYGGQLLHHYCDQKWHILRDMETESRMIWVNKNKQNYKYGKQEVFFMKNGSISKNKTFESDSTPMVIEYQESYSMPTL